MKKAAIVWVLMMAVALGNAQAAGPSIDDKYFSPNPQLTKEERDAIKKAMAYEQSDYRIKPVTGEDGSVRYLFGQSMPTIVCSPLQVTDIQLQPGESFKGIHIGDKARWSVEPAVTGIGGAETLHIIIKPFDVGLETSLIFLTDRRVYQFKLKSHRSEWMPKVSFVYPDEILEKWSSVQKSSRAVRQEKTTKEGMYLGDLDFDYDVEGSAPWKPVRVYNDGQKTVIEMPNEMTQTEAPALLVMRNPDAEDDLAVVNYRIHDKRYIVDSLFPSAILVAGVGGSQERVTITRRKK